MHNSNGWILSGNRAFLVLFTCVFMAGGLWLPATARSAPDKPAKVENLCSYDLKDFQTIKPRIEALFPKGMRLDDAKRILKIVGAEYANDPIPLEEHRWWVAVFKPDFYKFITGLGSPDVLHSGEILGAGLAKCRKGKGMTTVWIILLHTTRSGHVVESELLFHLQDEDFVARNLPLKPHLFEYNKDLVQALRSLQKTVLGDWAKLRPQLLSGGFNLKKGHVMISGDYSIIVTAPHDKKRLDYRLYARGIFKVRLWDLFFGLRVIIGVDDKTGRVIRVSH